MNLFSRLLAIYCVLMLTAVVALGQTTDAAITGQVTDPTKAVVPQVRVAAINVDTNIRYEGKTNQSGMYLLASLPPGNYKVEVDKTGFRSIIRPDIILHVQDRVELNFEMAIGSTLETITVVGGTPLVSAESSSVGSVVDRQFVEQMPLNGRSFNSLLQLTPGVVIAPSSGANQGQYSIDGQRTSANNFLVDGVSANFGVAPTWGLGTSGTGAAQAFSALGGTSSLVSVEALQEFRIETSSFAPEFGRSPGGQVQLLTRSGTNQLHGGVYEYFRNTDLDANDWFANQAGEPRAAEHHNDFGAFLGGPIYKNKTFYFLSYEGVRLTQPNTITAEVPSEYARSTAPLSLAPFILAYSQPNDRTVVPGVYTASLTANYSNPASLDAGSIRIDHAVNSKLSIFGRYNEAPSQTAARNLSELDSTPVNTRTITVGTTLTLSPTVSDAFRFNYSLQRASFRASVDTFAGATPPSLNVLAPGLSPGAASQTQIFFVDFDTTSYNIGPSATNRSMQLNFADDINIAIGHHQLKAGTDYRAIYLDLVPPPQGITYVVPTTQSFLGTSEAELFTDTANSTSILSRSISLYGQDLWKATPRLSLTYGLRWEIAPAPQPTEGVIAAFQNINTPATFNIAPWGTQLWRTRFTNFAPRVGFAYRVTPKGDLVVRGGWGIFYDPGGDAVGYLGAFFPHTQNETIPSASLPLPSTVPYLPPITTAPPYPSGIRGYDPNVVLPRSYQWNVAIEKSFAGTQALSLTYVGQLGRNLLRQSGLEAPNANFAGAVILTDNSAHSNYNALQISYRRPLSKHIQALASYSWSHSLDNASDDVITAISNTVIPGVNDYASSDFDVRHSFSAALNLEIPKVRGGNALTAITEGWSLHPFVVARTGFPFNGMVLTSLLSGGGVGVYPRPNLVAGQPLWIPNPSAGGGKSLNPAAFTLPAPGEQGTEPRNDISGFDLVQTDISLSRRFKITERVALQFRTDAFNVFNHPNFSSPYAYIGYGETFLGSPSMANHGLGGLNPLFQEGGPRSLQLSLRLTF